MPSPLPRSQAQALIARRHPEWAEHWRAWRKLADSLEGGQRYQFADYTVPPDHGLGVAAATRALSPFVSAVSGWPAARAAGVFAGGSADPATSLIAPFSYGSIVDRNLVPHANEMGEEGRDLYLLRLARTPPPTDLGFVIERHLARVFGEEIRREGPPELESWWKDVDGSGSPIRRWIEDEVGPLLLALGQLDLVVDHPAPPPAIERLAARAITRRDLIDMGLAGAVASIILPENVLWWDLDHRRRYREVLTLDRDADGEARFLHWHGLGVDAYEPGSGRHLPGRSREYRFGAPPIARVFDRRKVRCQNVGRSRYEGIADKQRARYNAHSERILADVLHSHPQLQAPADLLGAGAEITVSPGGVLPMVPIKGDKGYTSGYAGWGFLDPPTGSQEAIRQHCRDLDDAIEREGAITKPAGSTTGSTVSQSGVSKALDQQDGCAALARVAEVLENAERAVAELALIVLGDAPLPPERRASVEIEYPRTFDLGSSDEVAAAIQAIQTAVAQAGELPRTEAALLGRMATLALVGAEEDFLAECRDEIAERIDAIAAQREASEAANEAPEPSPFPPSQPQPQPVPTEPPTEPPA